MLRPSSAFIPRSRSRERLLVGGEISGGARLWPRPPPGAARSGRGVFLDDLVDLLIREDAAAALGRRQDRLDQVRGALVATLLQPVNDVGFAAVVADLD